MSHERRGINAPEIGCVTAGSLGDVSVLSRCRSSLAAGSLRDVFCSLTDLTRTGMIGLPRWDVAGETDLA